MTPAASPRVAPGGSPSVAATLAAASPSPRASAVANVASPVAMASRSASPVAGASPAASPGAVGSGPPPSIVLQPLPAKNLAQPLYVTHAGDGSGRLFVVEKGGRILVLKDSQSDPHVFLDLSGVVGASGSEQGLLGLAFHPRYRENGRFFVDYTDRQGDTVIAEYRASSPSSNQANPSSARRVLWLDQPAQNHNGGMLLFGPDDYLWIGTGDGGGSGDRFQNAQNRQSLLGKMLRIDVDSGDPYGIPPDNPYVGATDTRPEIWGSGLRNPWRYSFDRATGDLWIADVGQNAWEEIDVLAAGTPGGLNFGWPLMEGTHCYQASGACDAKAYVAPIAEYHHSAGCSVTGGYVYRGQHFPALVGRYLFGDFCSGRLWIVDRPEPGAWRLTELPKTPLQISSFGEDESGELYVTSFHDNRVYRIAAPW
ncbi:MAG: PQQ-dependent sugar dehydrogenase [Chloroflexi bacterium]|nr:PQQ-dependent sugar dehydrogenase [Chloroflexota bacterium]